MPPAERTTMRPNSSGSVSWSLVAIVRLWASPSKEPSAESALALAMAVFTASSDRPIAARRRGSSRTRIAGCSAPLTSTSATPSTCATRWATTVSATS